MQNDHPSCCSIEKKTDTPHTHENVHDHTHTKKRDIILTSSTIALFAPIVIDTILNLLGFKSPEFLHTFASHSIEILFSMWWGIALGIIMVGLMSKMPKDFFSALMGKENSFSGLLRAVLAGVFLDLCCHGILLIAAKLYERGVSVAQVMTFLIASPWNSPSLTLVLIGLIGLKWTLAFLIGSIIIAVASGFIFQKLSAIGLIPSNPHKPEETLHSPSIKQECRALIKSIKFSRSGLMNILHAGWDDGKMIIKWLIFGTLIAVSIRTFVPHELFANWFGPTLIGLFLTVIAATLLEICSEGSAPVAAEIFTRAAAPGNAFAFLMAGVATDYTEILAVKQFTKSTKIALLLPLVTVPQIILIAWVMNSY